MKEILVESPTVELYKLWLNRHPGAFVNRYYRITNVEWLDCYHGEVIVLNGGSMDARIRNRVAHLAACGELRVTRMEV